MMAAKLSGLMFLCFYVRYSLAECNSGSFTFTGGYLRYLGTLPELEIFTLCRSVQTDSDGYMLGVVQSYSTDTELDVFLNYGVKTEVGFDAHLNAGGQNAVNKLTGFAPSTDMFLCQVFDTNEDKIYRYLNGMFGNVLTLNNMNTIPGGGELLIGKSKNDTLENYVGKIGNFMIWDRQLSDQEIKDVSQMNKCPGDAIVNIQFDNVQPYGRFVQQEDCKSTEFILENSENIVQYVEYAGEAPSLRSSTICAWITTAADGSLPGAVGTYSTKEQMDLVLSIGEIIDGVPHLRVGVSGRHKLMEMILDKNTEYHFCLLYDNMFSNKLYAYINGNLASEVQFDGLEEIPGGGKIIIGQRQGCLGGCFDKDKAFNGKIRNFMIWSRSLSMEEIHDMASLNKCPIDHAVDMTTSNVVVHKLNTEQQQ